MKGLVRALRLRQGPRVTDPAATASRMTTRPDPRTIVIGCVAMILSVLAFTLLDTVNKVLVATNDAIFLSWGRSAAQTLLLLLLSPLLGLRKLVRTGKPWLHVARGICIAGVSLSVTLAIRHLPLTETYVIGFLTPFLATVIAALVLGERATPVQWGLITLGFVGVLIALRPGAPDADWYLLYPLAFAVCNAIYFVLTRFGGRTEHPLAQLFYVGVFATATLTVFLPWHWQTPPPSIWAMILLAGAFGTLGHMLLIKAFDSAPTAVVAPMVYFQIIWSTIIGYFMFSDLPHVTTLIGAAVIVVAGVALIRSQARQR
jgi:drug/metabolite transporter (DMT)-like permease